MGSPFDPNGPTTPPDPSDSPASADPRIDPQLHDPNARSSSESLDPGALDAAILSYNSVSNSASIGPANPYLEASLPQPEFSAPRFNRFLDPDLRVPWGWLDLLLLVVVYIGANVLSVIFLAIVFASRGIPFTVIQHSPRDMGFFVLSNQLIVYAAVLLYLWVQARTRLNAPFWSTFGWRPLALNRWPRPLAYLGFVALGFILSASVELVSAAFPPKGKLPIETLLQNHQAALALMAMSVILAPVVEETIFRGYLYPVAGRSFGIPAGIILTGTVFGLLHAEQLWGGWAQIALLVIVGIVFTWVRAAKRTVFASYLLHVSYNFLIVLGGLHFLHR